VWWDVAYRDFIEEIGQDSSYMENSLRRMRYEFRLLAAAFFLLLLIAVSCRCESVAAVAFAGGIVETI
jgi:hypothetical protein